MGSQRRQESKKSTLLKRSDKFCYTKLVQEFVSVNRVIKTLLRNRHRCVALIGLSHFKIQQYQRCINIQYIPRNIHTVFALLCFVVVIHWLIFPYPSGLLHWYCGNLAIAPVPAKQPWWIWINTSCEFIMNDCITTTKQSTTKPDACYFGRHRPTVMIIKDIQLYQIATVPCSSMHICYTCYS